MEEFRNIRICVFFPSWNLRTGVFYCVSDFTLPVDFLSCRTYEYRLGRFFTLPYLVWELMRLALKKKNITEQYKGFYRIPIERLYTLSALTDPFTRFGGNTNIDVFFLFFGPLEINYLVRSDDNIILLRLSKTIILLSFEFPSTSTTIPTTTTRMYDTLLLLLRASRYRKRQSRTVQ